MRILKCSVPVQLADAYGEKTILDQDINYIVPDIVVKMIKDSELVNKILIDQNFYEKYPEKEYKGQDLTGKTLITFRNGGIGDLMFQLPSLKKLKEDTGVKITIVCNKKYKCLFEGLDYVDVVKDLPFTTDDIEKEDYYLNFEGLIENNPDAELEDAYTLHAKRFRVEPDNLRPELSIDKNIEQKVLSEISKYKNDKKICIAWSASVPIRSIDPNVYANIVAMTPDNFKFFICGSKKDIPEVKHYLDQVPQLKNKIINWCGKHDDLRYTMALIKNSDCVIGPDSGLLHVAGGYGVPIIGLFGAFPSRLRLKHYKNSIGINAKSDCTYGKGETNNCFQHGAGSCHLANRKMEYYSPCMQFIKPNQIIYALTKLKIL